MKKYEKIIDAELDLHGSTANEARIGLDEFFEEAYKKGWSCVRIVVGKGIHSKNGPVLPFTVQTYLREIGLSYTLAKIQDGGEGAYEVLL